ncbi:pneumococcal serine-rich repeat protein isoform X6 [Bactrocera oleae]|uniref:pneumococcal serine-rich repeat protein isoform X6 n=1 Tax=Bactrocera oleae TaxID=104688 RepID=UPI00387E4963
MDLSLERDSSSALGSLFQQIINDLKNTSPLWEDFVTKATKLHQCLRAAIQAIAAYLDAFQKIADAATNSRGASKEIGTALTRVCLRHKAVESRLKTFTTAIMDCLVQPLQEKLEDWKRTVITIDKEHAKEYKRCRTELKKRSSDTLRLQKKARKGQSDTIQSLMDSHKQDVTLRRAELEEVEKKSLRSAMIEERLRYCTFVHMLQPVVKEECEVMSELGHLQEAMDSIALVTKEPSVLPQASEELIHDTKATMSLYPESPGGGSSSQGGCSNSLGSRKSSVCSISSMNSSGSSNSPGHHHYPRSLSQLISPAIRLKPGESSDSGFCSSPALTTQASTATSQSHAVSTWPPHSQDAVPVLPPASDRPHTISTAYEKGHQRPPLTVYTFQNPETILEGSGGSGSIPGTPNGTSGGPGSGANTPSTQKSPAGALSRPPLPVRCSSLERPLSANNNRSTNNLLQRQCPSPIPAHITKELSAHHAQQHMQQQQQTQQLQQLLQTSSPPPTYVNMSELANMAAAKITNQQQQQQRPVAALQQQHSIDSISSQFSNDSTASGNQQSQQQQHQTGVMVSGNNNSTGSKTRSHSVSSSSASSNTPSLHSHPSIESGTIATPLVGQTPTPSSGSSTPQNHYSPLLTNSPSSTAAGTPSGGSVTSGMLSGFVYNVNSPTPPQSGTASVDSDVLKITETDAAGQPTIVPIHETNTQQQETSNANNNAICIESQTTPTETSEQTCTNAIDSTATANDTESPTIVENDERSRASVLQKASMFEKQAAAAAGSTAAVTPGRSTVEAIYGTRRTPDEVYRTANPSIGGNHYQQPSPHQQQQPQQQQQHVEQQEVDKSFEDSIQELNNLIGELDSFQREIDASKRATATTTAVSQATTADGTVGDNCGDRPFPLIGTSSNSVVADNNKMGNNAKAITTLATVVTEAERVDMTTALTVICPPRPPKSPQCASNQTSGCGTDLSDTASDDVAADVGSLTSINNNHNNNNNTKGSNNNEHNASLSSRESCATGHDNNVRTLQQYNSDSELSRCYVSETSSLAGGYENPTFAHFATAVSSSSIAASSGVDEPADVGSVIGDNRSLMAVSSTTTADDCASHTSDTYQMPQQAADNGSDGGSNVVVIYDHQIPMTPDIDYVKQNSEIVVLRTKDPLQQQLGRQEMRELTQLPTSLCAPHDGLATPGAGMMSVLALSSSSLSCLGPNSPPHTATVAPAKQRLSSFRASSEQQLQLLGCGDNNNSGSELSLLRTPHHHHQQYANAGTPQAQTECSKEGSRRVATPPNAHNMHADTIIRRKAAIPPPKPSLSIFNGQAADHLSLEANASVRKSSSSSCRGSCEAVVERLTATPTPPPPLLTKANFKADLDAKIRKQKLKLQLQHEQQQHHELLLQKQQLLQEQQQLQHSPQSAANNTNSSIYLSNHSHNNLNHNNSNNTTINNITTTNTTTNSGVGNGLGNRNSSSGASSNTHNNSNNNNCNAISLNKRSCSTAMSNATTTKTTTASASASASASNHLAFVVKAASSHHHTNASASSSLAGPQLVYQNASASVSSASASASNSNINSANAKPNITPRPASLSGGVTRIARRSSVNTAKPPPPVRRSSSVTPSHTATGTAATQSPQQNQQQQQQQHQHYQQLHHLHPHANQQLTSATTTTIQNSPYDTVESLPPPPAYLLDSRQAQSSTPTPPPPSAVSATAIPSSSLKVAETVKALSAMRHKPASPNAIRHMQQQQQQQLQQSHQSLQYSPTPTPTPSSPSPTPIQLQQNIYSTTVKTFSSTALLPPDCNTEQTLHYDAYSYYNPYMEVRTTTQLTSAKMPLTNANHANDAKEAAYQTLPITPTPIYYYDAVTMQPTTMATTPTKSKHLQSNALQDTYGVNTALRTTPNKTNNPPVSPSYTSPPPYDFQHSKIELPPPLPPPNPNQQRSLKQQQQKQFVDHQYNTPATCTLQPSQYQHNNNQLQPKRQHEQIYDYLPSHQHLHSPKPQHKPQPQPQQQTSQIQQQQQLAHNIDALMIDNEDEPTVYSDNASFRTSSPGIYAQPKIVTSMSSFRSASPAPTNDHHNQHHHVIPPTQPKTNPNLIAQLSARLSKQNQQQHTGDGIYGSTPNSPNHHNMHQQQLQQQQHQHQHHQSEPVYMRNYTHPHHQQHQPHQQQQMPSVATGSMHQQQNYDAAQTPKHQSSYAHAGGVARQQQQQQQQQHHSHHREPHTHSCPPPLENPPPPPTNSSIYAATANATATMPKNATRSNVSATYAPPTSTMTLPKNLAQQRLQQQQHYQQQQQHYQQQQYQQSIATGANAAAQQHHQAQQHSQTTTVNQRAQMPLPYQQQQQMSYKQKSATLQSNHRQPPIPSRHSSVQQKIFVATNPFIQTTTIHCHSPASVHSQPASPTCSSPSSLASIYGTSSRSHHHHHHQQQQQQQHQHHGSGSGVGGGTAGNGFYAAPHNSTSYASSNIEKAGSIRSKTKAEFLENLNAKLAKQGLSGRAFAVRNLINSKALMYQNPQTLMRPSAQYRAQPQAPPTPPTSSAEESSSH